MDNLNKESENCRSIQSAQMPEGPSTSCDTQRYGWRVVDNTFEAVKYTFDSVYNNIAKNNTTTYKDADGILHDECCIDAGTNNNAEKMNNKPDGFVGGDKQTTRELEVPPVLQDTQNHHCQDTADITSAPHEMEKSESTSSSATSSASIHNYTMESTPSIRSIGSFVCRICQNAEQPERLVSPCLCKGSLTYVHIHCLEHWISTSGKTTCELCQFRYKTIQTLRYTCLQSLRMWYSHSMSRRALQEDCQMFSLLTLVAFGIVGTILVGIQYYIVQEKNSIAAFTRIWTKSWLLFFLFTTFVVYFINVYMLVRGQLAPWYRWWQSAREIKLILENRKTVPLFRRLQKSDSAHAYRNVPIPEEEIATSTVFLDLDVRNNTENDGRRGVVVPIPRDDDMSAAVINNQQRQEQENQQPQDVQQQERQQLDNRNQVAVALIDI